MVRGTGKSLVRSVPFNKGLLVLFFMLTSSQWLWSVHGFSSNDKAALSLLIILLLQYGRVFSWPGDPKWTLFPQTQEQGPGPSLLHLIFTFCFVWFLIMCYSTFIHCKHYMSFTWQRVLCSVAAHILTILLLMKRFPHSVFEDTVSCMKCQFRFLSPFCSEEFQRINSNHIKQL